MIRHASLRYFIPYFCIFLQLQNFYHKDGGTGRTKGPPAENDRRSARRARGPIFPKIHARRRAPPTAPAFPGQSRQETVGATADG